MKAWTRLPDWIAIVAGIATAISPSLIPTGQESAATLVLLGALIAVAGFINLAAPRFTAVFWIEPILGVLLFIAPWVVDYIEFSAAAWFSWMVGVIAIVTGGEVGS